MLLLALFVLSGCPSLPDVRPFAEATAEVDLAVNEIHDFVVTDLKEISTHAKSLKDSNGEPYDTQKLDEVTQIFSDEWNKRASVTAAMVAYSDSLAAIVNAGKSGADSARDLANAANGFLAIVPNLGAIPDTIIDLSAWLKDKIDVIRANRSLHEAMRDAHPVVDQIADILVDDFDSVAKKSPTQRVDSPDAHCKAVW